MTTIILLSFIFLSLLIAVATGWIAVKTGRSFGLWFFLSMLLPMIMLCVLICLPETDVPVKLRKNEKKIINEQLFNRLLTEEDVILN